MEQDQQEMPEQAESRIAEDGIISHETPGKKVGEKVSIQRSHGRSLEGG